MLNADDPLLPSPHDFSPSGWGLLEGNPWPESVGAEQPTFDFHSRLLPAFDEHNAPITPPEEHVLDYLVRAYDLVDETEIFGRPAPNTVAVVELPTCDGCGAVARYDAMLTSSDGARYGSFLCPSCLLLQTDRMLGAGHSGYLMHPDEVPNSVRDICDELSRRNDRPSIFSETVAEPWIAVYRNLGFVGPDDSGRLTTEVLGIKLSVKAHPKGNLRLSSAHKPVADFSWVNTDEMVIPRWFDANVVAHYLRQVLIGHLGRRLHAQLPGYLDLTVQVAEALTLDAVRSGTYFRYCYDDPRILSGAYWTMPLFESLEHRASMIAIRQSDDELVLGELATTHPDDEMRGMAIDNPSLPVRVLPAIALGDLNPYVRAGALRHHDCPPDVLSEAADNDQSHVVRLELLNREDAPSDLVETLVTSLLTKMTSNGNHSQRTNWAHLSVVQRAVVHRHCPEKFVDALLDQITHADADTRESAARDAHRAMPRRRDAIHTRLLQSSRKGEIASRIIEAVVCPNGGYDAERAQWLQTHPDRGVRRLAELYLSAHEPELMPDIVTESMAEAGVATSEKDALNGRPAVSRPPAEENDVIQDHGTVDNAQETVFLDDIVLAVRLRRLWIMSIVPWLIELDHDLSYGWSETTLVRRGLILDVVTSVNFGLGDPFAHGVGEELSRRLAAATAGHVNQVTWKFRGDRPKPFRRKASGVNGTRHIQRRGPRRSSLFGRSPGTGQAPFTVTLSERSISHPRPRCSRGQPAPRLVCRARPGECFGNREYSRRSIRTARRRSSMAEGEGSALHNLRRRRRRSRRPTSDLITRLEPGFGVLAV